MLTTLFCSRLTTLRDPALNFAAYEKAVHRGTGRDAASVDIPDGKLNVGGRSGGLAVLDNTNRPVKSQGGTLEIKRQSGDKHPVRQARVPTATTGRPTLDWSHDTGAETATGIDNNTGVEPNVPARHEHDRQARGERSGLLRGAQAFVRSNTFDPGVCAMHACTQQEIACCNHTERVR